MYHFDDAPVDKGIEPDASSSNLSAVVVGNQVKSVAGKYGMALSFPGSKAPGNLAQIPADWWMADQPQQGCAVSAWIYIPHGGAAASGYIYERVYDGFELQFDGLRNQTHCSVRDAAGAIYTPQAYQHSSEDFGSWKHVVCSYNDTVGNTTMYVDGKQVGSVASKSIATTGLNHGDHQMFGFGARPTDAGVVFLPLALALALPLALALTLALTLALALPPPPPRPLDAGSGGGFTGSIDEVAIYKRALSAAEAQSLASRSTKLTPFPGVSCLLLRRVLLTADQFCIGILYCFEC
jgi:hypothetical protein